MFQKAFKEDFDAEKMKKQKKEAREKISEITTVNSTKFKISKRKNPPEVQKDKNMLSGGFFSSRENHEYSNPVDSEKLSFGGTFKFENTPQVEKNKMVSLDKDRLRLRFQSARKLCVYGGDANVEIEIVQDLQSDLKDKVLHKNKEEVAVEESGAGGPVSTKRDRYAISNMNQQEASERYRESARDGELREGEEDLCFICYTNPPNAVFLDCGHGGRILLSEGCVWIAQ